MTTNDKYTDAPHTFNSLADIRTYKDALKKKITQDENEIGELWTELFHSEEPEARTRGQKWAHMFKVGSTMFDGIMLGWKLYRKFGGGKSTALFGKRKHYK